MLSPRNTMAKNSKQYSTFANKSKQLMAQNMVGNVFPSVCNYFINEEGNV